ncbi:MAG: hypothetical protein ACJAYU_004309 [Bradymonadia bacterium]
MTLFGFSQQDLVRLRQLPLLCFISLLAGACGAQQPVSEEPPTACELASTLARFHASLALGLEATPSMELLDIWWEGAAANAAALFHTDGQSAIGRREFFDRHIFTDAPTLTVDGDSFALTSDFALAAARLALASEQTIRAETWLRRSVADVQVDRCLTVIGSSP